MPWARGEGSKSCRWLFDQGRLTAPLAPNPSRVAVFRLALTRIKLAYINLETSFYTADVGVGSKIVGFSKVTACGSLALFLGNTEEHTQAPGPCSNDLPPDPVGLCRSRSPVD